MSQAAVQSIEALREFRAAIAIFGEDAEGALQAVDMEIRRTVQWLQHDQRIYWENEIKRRREKLAQADAELHRRKLSGMFGHAGAFSEQKEMVRRAKGRLEDAERRSALVRKWTPQLQQAVLEYKGHTRRLLDLAGGDLPRSLATLDRLIAALEAYADLPPPSVFEEATRVAFAESEPTRAEAEAVEPTETADATTDEDGTTS